MKKQLSLPGLCIQFKVLLTRIPSICLLLLALFIFSCQTDDALDNQPVFEDPDWIRLEIPNGRGAYAVAGDLNKTLLVSTFTKAYYTTDQGKTWQESKDFQGPVMGLMVRNDTILALKAGGEDLSGQQHAGAAQYFTTDFGKSWQYLGASDYYYFYTGLMQTTGLVQAPNNITYQIKHNSTPISPGATTAYVNPSELQKKDSFKVQTLRLPATHKLLNLHLDASNRLYVAASGGTFTPDNVLHCCEDTTPAIIYVSKKPLP